MKTRDIITFLTLVFLAGVVNPQTNVEIELPGKPVGTIQVASVVPGDVNSEVSICTRISGDLPTTEFADYYVQEN